MLRCGVLGSSHLPVIFAIIFFLYLTLTYIFAGLHSDVDSVFSFVSAAGDHRPKSCLVSLLLNISSFISMIIIYLRYLLIDTLIRGSDQPVDYANIASLYIGLFSGFAMMVVANVQEISIIVVHLTAAVCTFGGGLIYMYMQTWITVHMYPLYVNRRIGIMRSAIALLYVFHQPYPNLPTPRPWNRKIWQPGYECHVISAISESIMAVLNVCFLLSYSRDFEKIRVEVEVMSLVIHLDHSPLYRSLAELDM